MKRSLIVGCVVASLTFGVFTGGARAESVTVSSHRYGTQVVFVGLSPVIYITDYATQQLFVYSHEGNVLQLRETINLSETGQPTMKILKAPTPATRPAK